MTTQRTFEPHEFAPYAEANNICRHCDRGRYALHHEQPRPEQATTEFDQVFDQMEAPEYPATCDNCGEVGTNASMEQHECDEHDAPAAPERGDDGVNRYLKSEIEHLLKENSTLITQRERLLRLLRPVTSPTACYCAVMGSEKCWHCEARELITTIEQDRITSRTTSEQEGRTER